MPDAALKTSSIQFYEMRSSKFLDYEIVFQILFQIWWLTTLSRLVSRRWILEGGRTKRVLA